MPIGLNCLKYFSEENLKCENCKTTGGIADDIQVFGNGSTYDLYLHGATERTRRADNKLKYDKCNVKSKSCSFFVNI